MNTAHPTHNEFRIVGPPGCGKTFTLKEAITEACQRYGSEAVLVCIFTKAAAAELVSRNLPLDNDHVGTLHAMAFRALEHPQLVVSEKETIKQWNLQHPQWRLTQAGASDLDDPHGDSDLVRVRGDALLQELNRFRGLRVDPARWPQRVRAFAQQWSRFKDEMHVLDFTDLIETCLREEGPIPHKAAALFLDEVQYFTPLELALARFWASQCAVLYTSGDDDQCIYGFKGASPNAFLSPELPPGHVWVLEQSHRIPRTVHAVATNITDRIRMRMPKAYRPRSEDGVVRRLQRVNYQSIGTLKTFLMEWVTRKKKVAFLTCCSYMLNPIMRQLREWDLPYHNPYCHQRRDWNPLSSRTYGISPAESVLAFLKVARHKGWWSYEELWAWCGDLLSAGLLASNAKIEMHRKADEEATKDKMVNPEDLDRWFIDSAAQNAIMSGDLEWLQQRLRRKVKGRVGYACRIVKRFGVEYLEKSPRITVGTIHSVKGGEADVVILFPDVSPQAFREYHSADKDRRDAVLRMFYVGVTRAKEELYLASPCTPQHIAIAM
jgi:superfamily I DNA/RNA helicase